MSGPGFALVIGLAAVHAFIAKLNISPYVSEHRWMSFAGGVSISYVFLEIFPELSHAQETLLEHSDISMIAYLENHVYLLALLGLLIFYGLDTLALTHRNKNDPKDLQTRPHLSVFWIHITAFALLNGIAGYLLQELSNHTLGQCLLFFMTISLHFFIIDHGLREHHQAPYDQYGRWLLTAAIVVGAIAGQALHLNEASLLIVWSFLAGSIILNILKRELPDETQSCFPAFVGGAALYTVLLLLV